jgi:uncharacterized protein YciI
MFVAWRDFIETLEERHHERAPHVAHDLQALEEEDVLLLD